MVFVACGLNHKTASLELREKAALPSMQQDRLLYRLAGIPAVNEAAILSTCNRTEIYCETDNPSVIAAWLAEEQSLSIQALEPYLYTYSGAEALRHTLRVAAGLDSMMLGEPQILGQMKQAYLQADRLGTIRNHLRPIFQYVFSASKRIRANSGVGNNAVSVAYAAVQLILQTMNEPSQKTVLLIGSGDTSNLVGRYLYQAGVRKFLIASRNPEQSNPMASSLGGKLLNIHDLGNCLPDADMVVSATACPYPFIGKTMVEQAMAKRNQAPMLFIDLAIPRDIESNVQEVPSVQLYNIDDLEAITNQAMNERRAAASRAEFMVDYELENYFRDQRGMRAKELICEYREQMQELADLELRRSKQKLQAGQDMESILYEFSERLLKKIIHAPTVGLRKAAKDERKDILDLARYLFNSAMKQNSYEKIT